MGTYFACRLDMNHNVFISHSSHDKEIANAICHYLEDGGIRCWIAPRDIDQPDWAASIMGGIRKSDVFVVILSHNSIPSNEVMKEVAEATRVCDYILPFKIDEEMLSDGMQYHLGPIHWMDAVTPPMEQRILELRERIQTLTGDDKAFKNHARMEVVGKTVMPRPFFVGRQEEISRIREMLQQEHVLFLQGMGGIGKSEIAKGYAAAYKHSYDTVVFASYQGSLLDMVVGEDIQIKGLRRNTAYGEDAESAESYFARKLQALKNLSSEKTLLIVDNFDVKFDDRLEDFVCGPYHVLFTTRNAHKDYPSLPVGPIQDFEVLRKIFKRNYGDSISAAQQQTVDQIIRLVNGHTITIELIAKQMEASYLSPEEMLELLKKSGTNSGVEEDVERDGKEKSAFGFIKDLFHLSSLSQEEQYILKCMCLVPVSGIHVRRLKQYLELKNLNVVNQLVSKSWLMMEQDTKFIKLHPIICDVVKDQLKPDQTSCSQYIKGVWKDLKGAWFQTLEQRNENWPYADHIQLHYGTPTRDLYDEYVGFANTAWICSQFDQAIRAAKEIYSFTLKEFGDAGYKSAYAARAVAGAYFNAGREQEAEPYYYLGLEHMLKDPEDSYLELGLAYQKVARCAYTAGDFEKAQSFLDASFHYLSEAVERKEPGANRGYYHDTYVAYARMHMAAGNYQTAIEYSQKAYDLLLQERGEEVTSSAYDLSDMGICHSYLGNYEKAAEYLQRALDLNIRFNGEASMVTVRTREAIADNLARQGDAEAAKSAYLRLEMEMEKSFGDQCPQVRRLSEKRKAIG